MSNFRPHVQKAVDMIGSQAALGEAIGESQQYVWHILNSAKSIKAEVAVRIELATNGKVSRSDLRPDIFGPAQSETAA